jgi:hypothetical protein
MDSKIDDLTSNLKKNTGATEKQLNEFMLKSGLRLPDEYLGFLKVSDGVEGFVGEHSYLVLWPIEQLLKLNEDYEVEEFAPGLLIFGSDGGDTAYAYDTRSEEMPIVEVPFIGMNLEAVTTCGTTFVDFLQYLHDQ